MQLRRVEVRNIRSYRNARLELGPGTTLLVGDVGSGKTSLLYAVEMGLFGAAEIDATFLVRHGATEAAVVVGLEEGGHLFEIERSFRRTRRKGRETFEPGRLSFRRDGAATSYSATELRQQVIDLLGFRDNPNPRAHSDLWRWAVYVPQEQMRAILASPPVERLETVRRALGVERYRIAAENAKEVAREFRHTSTALRAQAATLREFAEDLEHAAGEARRLEAERERIRPLLEAAEVAREEARSRAAAAQRRVQELEPVKARLADLLRDARLAERQEAEAEQRGSERRAQITRASTEIETFGRAARELAARRTALEEGQRMLAGLRSEAEERSVAAAKREAAESLLTARRAELAEATRDVERRTREVERGQQAVSEAEPEGGSVVEPVAPTSETLDGIDRQLDDARRTERTADEAVALARRGSVELHELIDAGVCPRCHQTVRPEEFASHESEARAELAAAEDRLRQVTEARQALEALRRGLEEHERARVAWQSRRGRVEELRSTLERERRALADSEERAGRSARAVAEAARDLEAIVPLTKQLEEARSAVQRAEREVEDRRRPFEESRLAEERRTAAEQRLAQLRAEEERAAQDATDSAHRASEREAEMAGLRTRLATEEEARRAERGAGELLVRAEAERHRLVEERGRLSGLAEAARERLYRAEAARVERDRLTRDAEVVDAKATWLASAFHDAVLTMEQRVLEHAQAEFARTFRSYFAALMDDPDLVAVTDSTFSPAAEIRGVETPAEALSGGERTSLALAYRLALSKVVRSQGGLRLDTLLLDEPTDGFSPEQVQSMGELLEELHLPQVLLVSHERELEAVVDRVVVVEKKDGISVLREGAEPVPPEVPAAAPTS